MSRIKLVKQAAAPDTPGANQVAVYVDANNRLARRADDGTVRTMADRESDNVFAVAQTINGLVVGGVGQGINKDSSLLTGMHGGGISLAANAELAFSNKPMGMLLVLALTTGAQGAFMLGGDANSVYVWLTRGAMTGVKDTAANVNVYYDSSAGAYKIQNKTAGACYISAVGLFA